MNQLFSHLKLFFINLHRATDHLHREISGKPLYQYSSITPEIFVGGQYQHIGIETLKDWGVTGVINMREVVPPRLLKSNAPEVLHLPTPDQHAPTIKQLLKGVAFIKKHLKHGGKVYVHCRWGEGRGPTMALAHLISQGITLEDAEKLIRHVRPFINPTFVQRQRLMELEKYYSSKSILKP